MTIIKHGITYNRYICENCHCVFECNRQERMQDFKEQGNKEIKCPECGRQKVKMVSRFDEGDLDWFS